jgi:biopolymer transport protein ExbB
LPQAPAPDDASADDPEASDEANPGGDTIFRGKGMNLLTLLLLGGLFMIPLAVLSVVVVTLGIERALALREEKMMPRPFVRDLGHLSRAESGFDPRMVFRACQVYPSAAARVLRVMVLKAGRPPMEIEHAVSEACQREATRLMTPVSWLALAAAVAPLIGLLGTVWGMIQAFYETTQLLPGQNKATLLAEGIYLALVTTLAGLIIAIPASIMAHHFDNRIVLWFHRIEELCTSLIPLFESFEGKVRTGLGTEGVDGHSAGDDGGAFAEEAARVPSRPGAAPR